ncbi:MAG: cysteine desulfurase family protein [Candidatus Jorgensenbacteria bacterium]|nr:cysteine desulfurase family protein [Candidatus Jorgensenbacteria bacterium]
MKRIYFDHAASTPTRKEVIKAMTPYFSSCFGNPSSLHSFGQEGIKAIDKARETVAHALNAQFREIVFTGSATEANNLALRGSIRQFKLLNPNVRPRILVSAIEHESVLETAKDLERDGVERVIIPVNESGLVDVERIKKELNERTVLISVMYVNNEIGSVQPLSEIAELIKKWKAVRKEKTPYPIFHTDAVQAFNYFDCNVEGLGVDMMTISGHKIGGPKGVGVLYVRDLQPKTNNVQGQKKMQPITTGGGQEFGMRSGTENVPCIVGFAEALRLASRERKKERARLLAIKKYFWSGLKKIITDVRIYGADEKHFSDASPHILNVSWSGAHIDDVIVRLDILGISASSGSACASRASTHSHVLSALLENASRGIRFSFGRTTTKSEIDETLKRMKKAFKAY